MTSSHLLCGELLEDRVREPAAELEETNREQEREITERMQTEADLEQNQQENRKLHESMMDGFVYIDMTGKIRDFDESYRQMVGYTNEELLQMTYVDLTPERWHAFEQGIVEDQILRKGYSEVYEKEYRKKDGTVFPVELRTFLIKDEGSGNHGMWAIVRDISRHRQAQEALRASESRFKDLVEKSSVGDFLIQDGVLKYVNSRLAEILGYRVEELVDKKGLKDITFPEDLPLMEEDLCRSTSAGTGSVHCEFRILRGSQEIRNVEVYGSYTTYQGKPAVIGTMLDITDRKRTEDEQKKSEEKFRSIFQRSPIGKYLYDANGHLVIMNQACLDLFGVVDPQEVKHFDLFQDPNLPPGAKEKILNGEVVRYETEYDFGLVRSKGLYQTTKTGTLSLDVVISPLSLESSSECGFLVQVVDLSVRKRTEEELLKLKKLDAAGVLAGGVAHDFNNLLSIIMGNIDIVRMDLPSDHPFVTILEDAANAAVRAKELTRRFITFSSSGAPLKRPSNLKKMLEDSVVLLLSGSNVEQRSSVPVDLWRVAVDEKQIRQAITNVILNAREAMPNGGMITIHAQNIDITAKDGQILPTLSEGRYVKISIKDQGRGIHPDHLERIFDPYFSTKERGSEKGIGLGLTIAHSVFRRHGGHIEVKTDEGVGTTVDIYLPASLESRETSVPEAKENIPERRRILAMDDEERMLDCIRKMLLRMGHEVEVASNGEQAIQKYLEAYEQGKPFDLVILDLTVKGGMGGRETIAMIRKIDPYVNAVVSSGYSHDSIMSDYLQYGFKDALAKPYDMKELEEFLSKVLKRSHLLFA